MSPKPGKGNNGRTGTKWTNLRKRVIAEEDLCCRCGRPVNKTLPGTHPHGPTADHIIELDRWPDGLLERSNLRLAHRLCNTTAGAVYGEQKRKQGRRTINKRKQSRKW